MKADDENILLMKILSNINRYKILHVIYEVKKDLCVKEIADLSKISQSLASHQLAYLSARGVIEGHRMGQTMCYMPAQNKLSSKLLKVLNLLSN